jgi:hypothetical protein
VGDTHTPNAKTRHTSGVFLRTAHTLEQTVATASHASGRELPGELQQMRRVSTKQSVCGRASERSGATQKRGFVVHETRVAKGWQFKRPKMERTFARQFGGLRAANPAQKRKSGREADAIAFCVWIKERKKAAAQVDDCCASLAAYQRV